MERLLKPRQVAELLGVSRSLAYQLLRSGELPRVVIGKSAIRVPESAVADYVKRRTHGGEAR